MLARAVKKKFSIGVMRWGDISHGSARGWNPPTPTPHRNLKNTVTSSGFTAGPDR